MKHSRRSFLLTLALSVFGSIAGFAAESVDVIYTAPLKGGIPTSSLHQEADGSFILTTTFDGVGGRGGVFRVTPSSEIQLLGSFYGSNGIGPETGVTKGTDGNFYGVTAYGGPFDAGTVFRMTPEGAITTIAKLKGNNGAYPDTQLVEAADGRFYGTAPIGGTGGHGVVFSVSTTGQLKVLANFAGPNGSYPVGLTLGNDGHLYGLTSAGGNHGSGTIFRVTTSGEFTILASFNVTNGASPACPMTVDTDGTLYGVTEIGGAANEGVLFKFDPTGGITKLADFSYPENGAYPQVSLVRHSPGVFVGLVPYGGGIGNGILFQATSTGTITKLVDLPEGYSYTAGPLFRGNDGAYYTAMPFGGTFKVGEILRLTTDGNISSVVSFGTDTGIAFQGDLTMAPDGTLFGTAYRGGADNLGTLFKVTTEGDFEKLSDFTEPDFSAGSIGGLTLGTDGNFYGTTGFGGDYGTLFRATQEGALAKLVTFDGTSAANPAGILQASDGAFYGTTFGGGEENAGVVFKYTVEQGFEILSQLNPTTASGSGRLIEARDGFFYGVTYAGGPREFGTVIRVGSNGSVTVIASFNGKNGAHPYGRLLEAEDGSFYGLVSAGGKINAGGIFRVTPEGNLSLVASLDGFKGAFPRGDLVQGPRGELYGVASAGGVLDRGTIFRFSPKKKKLSLVHEFKDDAKGAFPLGSLVVGKDYNLYGTTYHTIFRVNVDNTPPVAENDTFELPAFNVKPLKNDKDADKDPLRIVSIGTAAHGEVILHEDNTISYLPADTFAGEDTFTYTITDGFSEPVTAQITVRQPLNPLKAGAGAYGGLVLHQGGSIAGYWGIVATKQGLFTGALRLNGKKYSIKGLILSNGQFTVSVPRKDGEGMITITGTVDSGRNIAQGTIDDGTSTYILELYRTFPLFTRDHPTPAAGRYTILLPVDPTTVGVSGFPQGNGYAIMNVTATGIVTISGKLGDGAAFSAGSLVTRDNTVPIYGEAYKKKGYIAGLIDFTTATPASDASAVELYWVKPSDKGLYPLGFFASPGFLASRYQKPARKQTALSLNSSPETAQLAFDGLAITKTLSINVKNVATVINPAADNVKITINPKNGFFTGKYVTPADGARRAFGGVLFQKTQRGAGTYVTKDESGTVNLTLQE